MAMLYSLLISATSCKELRNLYSIQFRNLLTLNMIRVLLWRIEGCLRNQFRVVINASGILSQHNLMSKVCEAHVWKAVIMYYSYPKNSAVSVISSIITVLKNLMEQNKNDWFI